MNNKPPNLNTSDEKSEPNFKKLFIVALADLSYAQGVLDGLGKPNNYLAEQVGCMMEDLISSESSQQGSKEE